MSGTASGEATPPRIVAAFDKFRHTATAHDLCLAVGDVGWELGIDVDTIPLADGGEGTLDVLAARGGSLRRSRVHGPLGELVEAMWLLRGSTAFIEMARASGLELVAGRDGNDALRASTQGTGELIVAAHFAGASRIVVTLGGSATTDGGLGALEAMEPLARFRGTDFVVACDVETRFLDAAKVFGPQKGASDAEVALLTRRLESLAERYERERGVDVRVVRGGGAAGGLAGGLVSIGATIESGFALVAEELDLAGSLDGAALAVTGEGFLDAESFHGKVVGGVCEMAAAHDVGVVIVCGGREAGLELPDQLRSTVRDVVVLSERFDPARSWDEPLRCVRDALPAVLGGLLGR